MGIERPRRLRLQFDTSADRALLAALDRCRTNFSINQQLNEWLVVGYECRMADLQPDPTPGQSAEKRTLFFTVAHTLQPGLKKAVAGMPTASLRFVLIKLITRGFQVACSDSDDYALTLLRAHESISSTRTRPVESSAALAESTTQGEPAGPAEPRLESPREINSSETFAARDEEPSNDQVDDAFNVERLMDSFGD